MSTDPDKDAEDLLENTIHFKPEEVQEESHEMNTGEQEKDAEHFSD